MFEFFKDSLNELHGVDVDRAKKESKEQNKGDTLVENKKTKRWSVLFAIVLLIFSIGKVLLHIDSIATLGTTISIVLCILNIGLLLFIVMSKPVKRATIPLSILVLIFLNVVVNNIH